MSGLINIQNTDNECFKWCCEYHKSDQAKNTDRVSKLKKNPSGYDYTNVNYPASFEDIAVFEATNNESVFVYGLGMNDSIVKLKDGNHANFLANEGKRMNLLLINDGEVQHYIYIYIYISRTSPDCSTLAV